MERCVLKLTYDNVTQHGDIEQEDGGNLATDEGLETAVTTSLFTDARAKESDDVDPDQDPRGWWGEVYLSQPGPFGSRLWLLRRNKLTNDNLRLASDYAKEALAWMIAARAAASIEVSTVRMAGKTDVAVMTIRIERPRLNLPRFERAWEVQFGI
jgi:phage gp46-like protein